MLDQYSCPMVQTRYSKESKTAFKMLQNILWIVCIKKATKCVVIFPSQNDMNVGVSKIYYFIKLFMNILI